jgi:hypothetical protein
MATISNQSLTVENLNDTTVRVTVKYRLTPSNVEKLAGTVFSENIQLIGDDGDTNDGITSFPGATYAVSSSTPFVDRSRIRSVLKSTLNEDPGFQPTGAELVDETFARIKLAYAANAPNPPTLPPTASTNSVKGAWK